MGKLNADNTVYFHVLAHCVRRMRKLHADLQVLGIMHISSMYGVRSRIGSRLEDGFELGRV
jgi:hypothetical protein